MSGKWDVDQQHLPDGGRVAVGKVHAEQVLRLVTRVAGPNSSKDWGSTFSLLHMPVQLQGTHAGCSKRVHVADRAPLRIEEWGPVE
jgi:hypothetical protein